jgi:prolyl 4-hydroxylase
MHVSGHLVFSHNCDHSLLFVPSQGTYSKKLSTSRTSSNAWCQGECELDPVTQAVTKRMEDLTGIPSANFEYFQLLQYEIGQYYKQHHDYIDFHQERKQGVRTLTIFLYLNTVEAGGGTNFPLLNNMTVMPKRGRALIWPSVLDANPNERDPRTDHQALPVEKGVKFGANAWIHQRDFKEPFARACI